MIASGSRVASNRRPCTLAFAIRPRIAGVSVEQMQVVAEAVALQPSQRRLKLGQCHRAACFAKDALKHSIVVMGQIAAARRTQDPRLQRPAWQWSP